MKKVAIIGAGISGITATWALKQRNKHLEIDLFESREDQIAGNCYDSYIGDSYLQKYGPHIFHTNNREVWIWLNKFCKFDLYQHKVYSYTEGQYFEFPLKRKQWKELIEEEKAKEIDLTNAETYLNTAIGKTLTDMFFRGYSKKQWNVDLCELPIEIVQRIPIRENNDTRYFTDKYQGMPYGGYSSLFENILLDCGTKIKYCKKNIKYKELENKNYDLIILTGRPDFFFENKYGELQYRKLIFNIDIEKISKYQKTAVINYPNDYDFTRITAFDMLSSFTQLQRSCFICREYPSWEEGIDCYPILFDKSNRLKFIRYEEDKLDNVLFLGRLGKYKYLNMDQAIEEAFDLVKRVLL
jgi:UDP-galactopyranose mutase